MWSYGPYGMMGYGGWGMGVIMLFGTVFWILVLILISMLIVRLTRGWPADIDLSGSQRRSTAADLLAERYARGEIDRTEYMQKKRDIADPLPG